MSTWRQKAIEIAPELKNEFQSPDLSPYTVFSELLVLVEQAYENDDVDRLNKIYGFAAWCLKQKDQKLWNAAGVSFYEHLGDTDKTYPAFTNWVTKEIYAEIRNLLEWRLDDEKMKTLDRFYGWKKPKSGEHDSQKKNHYR